MYLKELLNTYFTAGLMARTLQIKNKRFIRFTTSKLAKEALCIPSKNYLLAQPFYFAL
ncbi:hypothetical protein AAOGI_26650 [Agarivorans albus]